MKMQMKARSLTEGALLTALALGLFAFELKLPNPAPIPGAKLGLANIVTVYAVYRHRPGEATRILFCRIILGAFFGGQAVSLLYSFAGGTLCFLGMLGLRRVLSLKHIWLCSVLGAALHNLGQICAAMLIAQTTAILGYLPVLMLSGCIAGLFTGLCAQYIVNRSADMRGSARP